MAERKNTHMKSVLYNIFYSIIGIKRKRPRVPNIDSLSALIDRLAIECAKASWFENMKRIEQAKKKKNLKNIQKWDHLSREAIELRSAIKNKIDELFKEVIETRKYNYLKEPRTFSAASNVLDIIDKRYSIIGDLSAAGNLIDALEWLLSQ